MGLIACHEIYRRKSSPENHPAQEISNNKIYLAKTQLNMKASRKLSSSGARSLTRSSRCASLSLRRQQRSLAARCAALLYMLLYLATLRVARV